MNYFAHGMRFVDRPYFLAGTAVPDWLSVCDRKVRMRPARVGPFLQDPRQEFADLAAGVLQHLGDDRWFHKTSAFYEISGELTRQLREVLGTTDGHRSGFLGHILTELVLDGLLIAQQPERLDAYYSALDLVDPAIIQDSVNAMARRSTRNLARLIPLFQQEQFLRDYLQPPRLLFRLNQVMQRIKLKPLPVELIGILESAPRLIEPQVHELLPEHLFV